MSDIAFLTLADIMDIHRDQIQKYGGQSGLRDYGLLSSAVAMAEASFGGIYLHADLYEMAAAYLFHICANHPFIDGNKRTALATALVFLDINGIIIDDSEELLYEIVMAVANGKQSKAAAAKIFMELEIVIREE